MPAERRAFRYVSNSIHWLLIFGSLVLVGTGWLIGQAGLAEPDRRFLVDSHISLGLGCATLIVLQALLWTIRSPVAVLDGIPPWRKRAASWMNIVLYLALSVVIASGYLETTLAGRPISYWGIELPAWGAASPRFAAGFRDIHRVGAFISLGLIVLHVALSGSNRLARRGSDVPQPAPPSSEGRPRGQEERETAKELHVVEVPDEAEARRLALQEQEDLVVSKTAKNLASNLRFFGWIEFWVQFVLGLIIGLLLAFASSGAAFSPSKAGFGDALYWGFGGFVLLCPAIILAFYYTRASRKVVVSPIDYLHHKKRFAFWYLLAGLVIGALGNFVSFVGITMSLSLLIVKTISQPPGIAITDPNNIIRALDVFVLIVNFMLLIAHFVGVVIALWLGFCASGARIGYIAVRSHAR